jgi:hypothetical protein
MLSSGSVYVITDLKQIGDVSIHSKTQSHGFGGLEVACWPLVPKFVGSHLAEAIGFLGRKNPQHAFLRRGSKAVGPLS